MSIRLKNTASIKGMKVVITKDNDPSDYGKGSR
jgi:hypothetical protein